MASAGFAIKTNSKNGPRPTNLAFNAEESACGGTDGCSFIPTHVVLFSQEVEQRRADVEPLHGLVNLVRLLQRFKEALQMIYISDKSAFQPKTPQILMFTYGGPDS